MECKTTCGEKGKEKKKQKNLEAVFRENLQNKGSALGQVLSCQGCLTQ